MADYIEYNKLPVTKLRDIAKKLNLGTSGTKPTLIKRLKGHEATLDRVFNQLYEKYVPQVGKARTREGTILRLVSQLIYGYYNNGDGFYETLDEYGDFYSDLNIEDKKWFSEISPSIQGEDEPENTIRILNFMRDTIRRVEELEEETRMHKQDNSEIISKEKTRIQEDSRILDKEERESSEQLYTIIVELLDPREIEEVLLSTFERVPSLLIPRVSEDILRNLPIYGEFSFIDIKDGIPRKITLKKVILHQ